jgi:RNA recognition motif-containing protein
MAARATKDWRLDCKVYIGDLGYGAAKQEIEDVFSRYGPLRNVWVARNPPGFAFVEFQDPRDAEDATKALDGTSVLCNIGIIFMFRLLGVFSLLHDVKMTSNLKNVKVLCITHGEGRTDFLIEALK